jgi:hypothetical protein
VSAIGDLVEHHLDAIYFDTEGLRLAASRITVRRRTGGGESGWHVKRPTAGPHARTETGSQQIFVMNADGTNQQQLTFGDANSIEPVWSPDGSKIAFTSHAGAVGAGNDILVMNPNGSKPTNLTNDPADDAGPDWQALPH